MKNNSYILKTLFLSIFFAIFIYGCEENNYPDSIYDPDDLGKPSPIITSIEPDSGKVFSGIDTVWINGSNFSNVISENSVFFSGEPALIVSATEIQLIVIAPPVSGIDVLIQVAVEGAFNYGEWSNYSLFESVVEVIAFGENMETFALAMNKGDSLFISLAKPKAVILRLSPEGAELPVLNEDSVEVEYSPFSQQPASGMKWGPDGSLYYVAKSEFLITIPPGGGDWKLFPPNIRFPGKNIDLDFDENNVIYAAGDGSAIYTMTQDGTSETAAIYDQVQFKAIRVYDGYVYVAGRYRGDDLTRVQEGIWKHEILDAIGTLGASELVFDWGKEFGYIPASMIAMAIAADGDIYISSDKGYAISVIHPDGRVEPLYPAVMPYEIKYMTWGSGDFLFASRRDLGEEKSQVLKIDMRKSGAPYYGRQ